MGQIYAQATKIFGRGKDTMAAGGFRRIDVVGERKFFVVGNCEASAGRILYITGPDRVVALPVFPQNIVTIATDSEFHIENLTGSGGTITYTVGEVMVVDVQGGGGGRAGSDGGGGRPGVGGGSLAGGTTPGTGDGSTGYFGGAYNQK